MVAQCVPAAAGHGGSALAIAKAVELPPSLRLKPNELRLLRQSIIRKFGKLFPPGVDPVYEADKMIDAQLDQTHQNLIKRAVDSKWGRLNR